MTDAALDEIAAGVFRISVSAKSNVGGAFTYNQFLLTGDAPMLFHTGHKRLFETTRAAVARAIDPATLRYIAFSHFEADECGALNEYLALAPRAEPVCGRIAAMTSIGDFAIRPPKALADGETISTGRHALRWLDAPHLPHGWETGYLFDDTTRTLFCGDVFTQPGGDHVPVTEGDILGPSEAFRRRIDYYAHARNGRALVAKLAATKPGLLACMHGASYRGDGAGLLMALADSLDADAR